MAFFKMEEGRPVRHPILRHWTRARRNLFCVYPNALRVVAVALPAMVRCNGILGCTDNFNGRTNNAYKNCLQELQSTSPTSMPPSLVRRLLIRKMAYGQLKQFNAFINTFCLPGRACRQSTASCPTKVSLSR
jgi:hypothetical protein